MCVQTDFVDKRHLTWSKIEFVFRDDPLSRISHSLLFGGPQPYLFPFFSSLRWAPRRRLVHVYAGSKVATERRMDHALCIIHHVIGSLSDSTPCRCYRVPRHGLVKHKHRETINKRNVARIPRYVSLSRWNPTEGKCPCPLPITLFLPFEFSRLCFSYRLGIATLFRSDFVSCFTRVAAFTLDHGSVVGAFHRILEHPRKDKPNHHFSIQPSTYHVCVPRDPYGDTTTCSSDITPNCLAYL